MASTCSACVAAGEDPETVTFDEADDFNQHIADEHTGEKQTVTIDSVTGEVTVKKARRKRAASTVKKEPIKPWELHRPIAKKKPAKPKAKKK